MPGPCEHERRGNVKHREFNHDVTRSEVERSHHPLMGMTNMPYFN